MQYMISWKISPGSHKPAAEAFLAGGAPPPEGLKFIGRWHAPGSSYGWVVVEGDIEAVAEHGAEWANLLECQITPVIGDEAAGAALAKVYKK